MNLYYLPNIQYFQELLKNEVLTFHLNDVYHRQTFRNRTEIIGPNGKMVLSIPTVKLLPDQRQFEKIKISYSEPWLKQHWKSFESAYRRSAYFEFYEDKFKPFYQKPSVEYLWEYNFELIKVILKLLKIEKEINLVNDHNYQRNEAELILINKPYTQVFQNKLAFEANLSVIDLLFNTGPKAKDYLIV
jgi:hypothetical protein